MRKEISRKKNQIKKSAHLSHTLSHFKVIALRGSMLLPSRLNTWLNHCRSLYKLKILVGGRRDLLILQLTKTSFALVNLPPANMELSACFFSLFLPIDPRPVFERRASVILLKPNHCYKFFFLPLSSDSTIVFL